MKALGMNPVSQTFFYRTQSLYCFPAITTFWGRMLEENHQDYPDGIIKCVVGKRVVGHYISLSLKKQNIPWHCDTTSIINRWHCNVVPCVQIDFLYVWPCDLARPAPTAYADVILIPTTVKLSEGAQHGHYHYHEWLPLRSQRAQSNNQLNQAWTKWLLFCKWETFSLWKCVNLEIKKLLKYFQSVGSKSPLAQTMAQCQEASIISWTNENQCFQCHVTPQDHNDVASLMTKFDVAIYEFMPFFKEMQGWTAPGTVRCMLPTHSWMSRTAKLSLWSLWTKERWMASRQIWSRRHCVAASEIWMVWGWP